MGRYVPPYQDGADSLYFETFNRNKRSVSLDLRHPLASDVLQDLAGCVDAVFSNLRGDQPDRLGLRYGQLSHVNPRIVCCSLSGFGLTGPRAGEGGYDHTIQGLAGWQRLTGEPASPPTKSGLSLVDFSAGYVAAIAILAAVWRARRDGRGGDVDLSLFETALSELTYIGTWVASRGYRPERKPLSAHQSLVPFQNFETSDGWIVVACPKEDLWQRLCRAIGRPGLATEDRFATFHDRAGNRGELLGILGDDFRSRTTSHWLGVLLAAGVPCAPAQDVQEALSDPQTKARGAVVSIDHPNLGVVKQIATPFRLSEFNPPLRRGPFLGEQTNEVLKELCGYEESRIEELRKAGLFGGAAQTERDSPRVHGATHSGMNEGRGVQEP